MKMRRGSLGSSPETQKRAKRGFGSTFEGWKYAGEASGALPKPENAPSEASGVLLKAENAPGEAMPCDVSCPERAETKKTRSLYPPPYIGESVSH